MVARSWLSCHRMTRHVHLRWELAVTGSVETSVINIIAVKALQEFKCVCLTCKTRLCSKQYLVVVLSHHTQFLTSHSFSHHTQFLTSHTVSHITQSFSHHTQFLTSHTVSHITHSFSHHTQFLTSHRAMVVSHHAWLSRSLTTQITIHITISKYLDVTKTENVELAKH